MDVRWFHYPSDDTTFTFIGSVSTRINYNLLAWWQKLPVQRGVWTDELTLRVQRSVFYRFFGLGPDAPESAESSYTGLRAFVSAGGSTSRATATWAPDRTSATTWRPSASPAHL
jgi:hypothetical protein